MMWSERVGVRTTTAFGSIARCTALVAAFTAMVIAPAELTAQIPKPTPQAAAALLQNRPDLVNQLRQRIGASGLTPEQVRARLKAEGYPENLLDGYLAGAKTKAEGTPGSNVFSAVRALGITDSKDLDDLEALATESGARRRPPAKPVLDSSALSDTTLSKGSAELFGLSMFRDSTNRFQPNLDGPVDPGYRLGPGDQLVLILTGDVELAHNLEVTREGFVVIPQVGQLSVANLTLGQLEDLLYSRLARAYSGISRSPNATTRFSVSVSRLRSNQVFVTGDVMTPGSFRISSAGTALTALYAAGGPSGRGSLRRVEVKRGGKTVDTLDVYDYLLRGDASHDVRLQQGDVVFVPVHGARVRIDGEVTRPATYELRPQETLADALAAAGGLRATAGARRVLIQRVLPPSDRVSQGADRAAIDVPLAANGSAPAFVLADGDVLRVPSVADRVRNRIRVKGHVWNEGAQGFSPGLTLEEALRRAGGPQPDAYLGRVLVSRLRADSTRVQLRAILRDSTGATIEPFALAEDDEITVFSKTAFRPERTVAIGGAVQRGGQFPWRQGMTLRDLVMLSGGLDESAYLAEAEIARIPATYSGTVVAQTVRVPLDSGYLFSDDRTFRTLGPEQVLQPNDNVLILRSPGWHVPASVQLTGEVRFPGRYTIKTRGEHISDLLDRAGGLTAQGDQDAAFFSRLLSASSYGAKFLDSTTAKGDSLKLSANAGRIRVGVDLAYALKHHGSTDDLVLDDGDSLHLPTRRQTVEVRGEVNAPTALAHAAGHSLGFYVDAAGGPTAKANARHAYVIQPNGKVESRRRYLGLVFNDPTPRAGSTVVVPAQDPNKPPSTTLAQIGALAQIVVSLVAVLAVLK